MEGIYDVINIARSLSNAVGVPNDYRLYITAASNIYLAQKLQKQLVIEEQEISEKIHESKPIPVKGKEWSKLYECSNRLKNILTGYHYKNLDSDDDKRNVLKDGIQDINNLTKKDFMKYRFAGKNTWEEFVKLRGY